MTPCCANSHMSVPLRVLTVRTSLYICIYSEVYIYHITKYFYMWTHVVRTHICLCPCECSHLEPLCIHTCAHKYTYIPSQILLYMNPCCASWHMFVPLRVLTPRTSLYTYIYSQVYIYQTSYHGYVGISTRAVHSHTCLCPCECSHLEPLCIQIFTSIRIHASYHG